MGINKCKCGQALVYKKEVLEYVTEGLTWISDGVYIDDVQALAGRVLENVTDPNSKECPACQ